MNLFELFEKIIPNPLSKQSTLASPEKKMGIIIEGLNITKLIKHLVSLVVIGFVLGIFLKIPVGLILILIGLEIFSSIVVTYIKYLKIKAFSLFETNNEKDYKQLEVTSRYYNLICSIVKFCISSISVGLLFLFFRELLSELIGKNTSIDIVFSLRSLIIAFVFFRFFSLLIEFLMYQFIKNINENQNIAQVKQKIELINIKYGLIKNIPIGLTALVILTFTSIPFYFVSIFWLIAGLLIIMTLRAFWRINRLDLSTQKTTAIDVQHPSSQIIEEKIESKILDIGDQIVGVKDSRHIENINLHADEKVVNAIFGIMNLKRIGAGLQMNKPENSLLITDYRLIFIQIPMTGGSLALPNYAFGDMNFFWNRGEIKERGNQIIQNESLSEIIKNYGMREIIFDNIVNLTLKKMEITILTSDDEKHKYLFMDKEYVDSLKKEFKLYLKERFIEAE